MQWTLLFDYLSLYLTVAFSKSAYSYTFAPFQLMAIFTHFKELFAVKYFLLCFELQMSWHKNTYSKMTWYVLLLSRLKLVQSDRLHFLNFAAPKLPTMYQNKSQKMQIKQFFRGSSNHLEAHCKLDVVSNNGQFHKIVEERGGERRCNIRRVMTRSTNRKCKHFLHTQTYHLFVHQ